MEVPPSAPASARNGGFAMPAMSSSSSQPSRKEWRVVSEQSVRNSGNEELERSKLVQSDERLIYEVQHGREPVELDFCSITIDRDLDTDILQQRLHTLAKQREELLHMEIELRAQNLVRSEISRLQNAFDAQMKEHGNANVKLQEQLHEKEQKLRELEMMMEDKDRELHAIRLDNEAAWAKEDLLREQSKELQSYRRERDNSEAERVQHINQIRELQEHIQEKDRLFMELQEQHRIAQETILFKEEQLREAQAWMTRAQEMDALQSTTNHNLQAELRERTEHYNQLWLACQRQFGEMERLHLHIQQFQLELADAREKTGSNMDGSSIPQNNTNDASEFGQSNGGQQDVNGNGLHSADNGSLQNGDSENVSGGTTSTQADNAHVVAYAPSSLLGIPPYVPPGQVTALHPFMMHQQGVPHPSHVMQSHFHSVAAMPTIQNWPQGHPDGQHVPIHNQYAQEAEQNMVRTDSNLDYEASGNGHRGNGLDSNISQGLDANLVPSANEDGKVLDSIEKSYDHIQSPERLQQVSSHFQDALNLDHVEHINGTKPQERQVIPDTDHVTETKRTIEQSVIVGLTSEGVDNAKNFKEITMENGSSTGVADSYVSAGQKNIAGKTAESYLLDERTLLASIARTIGSGGRIRISSTLPNRLGKMLAPLHWHDYKKKYGKLDDFIAGHPELFFIEGDYIQLREGAQEIIAATAAVAKVAAAAAAAPSYSSSVPSVALTPMAQSHRLKKASPSLESSYANVDDHPSQFSTVQNQINGGSIRVPGGASNVKNLSKTKDHSELNGGNRDRTEFSQSKSGSHGRPGMSSVGKQNRAVGAASSVRR